MTLARDIAARALEFHGSEVLAIGLYGSTGRGTDGPYSDVEVLCILRQGDADHTYEWSHGPWKAEVNFLGRDLVLRKVAGVAGTWPITHGAFLGVRPLYDPDDFFGQLREIVVGQPEESFNEAMRELIVGELYEWVGKLRNARQTGHTAHLPQLALDMAKKGAFLIGLANRHCYTTGPRVLEESLLLPDRPVGYDRLCHVAMAGDLADAGRVTAACEAFWSGVEQWAVQHGLEIEEQRRIPF